MYMLWRHRTPDSLFREYEDEDGSENRLIDRIIAQDNNKESDTVERISLYSALNQLPSREKTHMDALLLWSDTAKRC